MDVTRPATYDLSDYLSALRRSWWIATLAAIIGFAAAASFTVTQRKLYESSASVLVQPTGVQDTNVVGGRTKGDINLDTEAQLVKSTAVAADAGELLRSDKDPQLLARKVSVAVPPNTSVLVITYTEQTPRGAQAGAHAFAEAYLGNRNDSAKAELANQYNSLDGKIKQVNADLAALVAEEVDGEKVTADRRKNLSDQLNNLSSRLNQLSTTTINGGKIISDADLPTTPVKPSVPLNLGSGTLAGLVLGVGIALGRERLDRRVRRGIDLPRRADVPLLAELTHIDEKFDPQTECGRAFARLRNEIAAAARTEHQDGHAHPTRGESGDHRLIVVTGASQGMAATLVASNLAGAFAHAGNNVSLVTQHATDAGGQLQIETVRRTLEKLRTRAEYVIIEAPSTSASADAQSLASLADAAIMAVELRRTTHTEVLDAAEQLRRVDTALIGGVVTPKLLLGPRPTETGPLEPQAERQPQLT